MPNYKLTGLKRWVIMDEITGEWIASVFADRYEPLEGKFYQGRQCVGHLRLGYRRIFHSGDIADVPGSIGVRRCECPDCPVHANRPIGW